MILIGVILFIAAIVGNVIYDYTLWQRQLNKPNNIRRHRKGWRLKTISCLPSMVFMIIGSNFIWFVATPLVIVGEMILFNHFFDGGYNIMRGESFYYLGTEDGRDDAKSDNIWQGIPMWLHIFLKNALTFASIYMYYVGALK